MFSNAKNLLDARKILKYARVSAMQADNLTGCRVLIVGMPNVGKSTLLNALRHIGVNKKKAAATGGQPGVTRKIATSVKVCEQPLVYLIDSPGVFVPYVPNSETMLKLALVGCVKDMIVDPVIVVDYLLYRMNLHDPTIYKEYHRPTNNVLDFLTAVAKITGRLMRGGKPEFEATALWVLGRWRNGRLGRFMLDPVDEGAYQQWLEEEESAEKSNTSLKKEAKAERMEAKRARYARAAEAA